MADPLLDNAREALRRGETAQALQLSAQALQQQGETPLALEILATCLHALGRFADARPVYERLVQLQPGSAAHRVNLGTVLRETGELDAALHSYAIAASLGAAGADFLYNVGLLHKERGDYPHAWRLLREAHEAAPQDADIALQLAQCCQELLRLEEAASVLSSWKSFMPLDSGQLARVALQLLNIGELQSHAEAMQRLEADPEPSAVACLRMAQIHERTNRVAEAASAAASLGNATFTAEQQEELELLRAQIAQRQRHHAEAAVLFAALAEREAPHRQHLALFPLAKSQVALGHHAEAWATLERAHRAQMLLLQRSHPQVAAHAEPPLLITRESVDVQDFSAWRDEPGPEVHESPVFIVAFPRSGTTLLEQALDAHPGLVSMDEQPYLQQVVDHIEDQRITYPGGLAAMSPQQLGSARDFYWSLVRRKVTLQPGHRLVDKNPLNLLRLPVIRRLFPRSPIVLAIRHPLDVILSCYTQHFRAPEFALMCSHPAVLARGYRRCFDFWYQQQAILQASVMEVRYEELVGAFEPHMRALAGFLDLPWHEGMLRPADHARAKGFISTPSYAQVIEPVSTQAVGKWQPFAPQLREAAAVVEPYLARWNYPA